MARDERKGLAGGGGRQRGRNGHRDRWRALIAEWSASGLTQVEFCRRRKIHPMTFSGWKHRLGGKLKASPSGGAGGRTRMPAFVSVRVRPASEGIGEGSPGAGAPAQIPGVDVGGGDGAPIEVQLRNGRVLRVPRGVDPGRVARLASVLDGEAAGRC